jgi:quercetin dioxygenase-like cupin family protein
MKPEEIRRYVVTRDDAQPYSPPAHTETTNLLYLPKGALGSRNFEMVLGMPRRGGGGEPHFHAEAEQIVYVLAGHGETEIEGARLPIGPGTMIFHPAGQVHRELAMSDDFEVLVIYSPGIGVKNSRSFQMRGEVKTTSRITAKGRTAKSTTATRGKRKAAGGKQKAAGRKR